MREILFRGKRLKDGEWVEGWVTSRFKKFFDGELLTRIQSNVFGGGLHLVDTETVGQYTGLTDKNGKNIFEGDIVKIAESQIGFVVYECGAFGIGVKPYIDWDYLDSEIAEITGCNNSPYFCRCDNFISLWELKWNYNQEENNCYVIEVIGNIHDNPELLRTPQNDEVRE